MERGREGEGERERERESGLGRVKVGIKIITLPVRMETLKHFLILRQATC